MVVTFAEVAAVLSAVLVCSVCEDCLQDWKVKPMTKSIKNNLCMDGCLDYTINQIASFGDPKK
jgi:hypothetical protein